MKQEPRIGNLFGLMQAAPSLNHELLVDEALDAFTKAEQKMEAAIDTINVNIDGDHRQINEIQERIISQNKSKDRLARVLDRVRALTA